MLPRLYVISDSSLTDNITRTLEQCIDNGVPWVGIREYRMHTTALNRLVERIVTYAEKYGALVSVWDRPEVAKHFGIGCHTNMQGYANIQGYVNIQGVQSTGDCPTAYPFGVSTHTAQDITAVTGYTDYVTVSPLFDSISKPGYKGIGACRFADICTHTPTPVFALGGITARTAPMVLEYGAYGVCLCGDAMQNPAGMKHVLDKI